MPTTAAREGGGQAVQGRDSPEAGRGDAGAKIFKESVVMVGPLMDTAQWTAPVSFRRLGW